MPFMALTIAELSATAAKLRVQAAQRDYKTPGEAPSSTSRRYREMRRLMDRAADYEALAVMAKADE